MAANGDVLIVCLNELIQICRDAETGFQTAAEHTNDEALRALFLECSYQRAQFASELQSEVRQLGGDPARRGTVGSVFQRGLINIKSVVTGGDQAIIAECERGESAAVKSYQEMLKQNLPPNVLPVIKHQFARIKQVHDQLRALKTKAA